MLQPPVSDLAPWRPGHWITQTGYALNKDDIFAGTRGDPGRSIDMRATVTTTDRILEKVMSK